MVEATAISSRAVKVSLVMICLSQKDVGEDDHDEGLGLQQPADDGGLALLPFQDAAGDLDAQKLAGDRGDQQERRRAEHREATDVPLGAQARRQEEDRHDGEKDVVAEAVHLLLVEPVGSPLRVQACFRSSSMPAIQTNIITAHQAMPFRAVTTPGRKTKA